MAASIVHDLTGSPSTRTTHAPQFDVSQPQWVPVMSRWSRRRWTSRVRGSASAVRCSPLTLMVICISLLRSGRQRALGGAPQGSQGQLVREVALVLGRAAQVADRVAVLGREGGGGRERLLRRRPPGQGLL